MDIALEAAIGSVGLIKPQIDFYERHGSFGIRALDASSPKLAVPASCHHGRKARGRRFHERRIRRSIPRIWRSASKRRAHRPPLPWPCRDGCVRQPRERVWGCLLIVTRSSNPEGRAPQSALETSESSVEESLLREIQTLNAELAPGEIGPIGAVIGPTHAEPELALREAHALFLAPGIGAQGATAGDVAPVFASCPDAECLAPVVIRRARCQPTTRGDRNLSDGAPRRTLLADSLASPATGCADLRAGMAH